MIKFTSYIVGTLMLAVCALLPAAVSAQVSNVMPALYDQSGDQVNDNNSSALPAGYYFLDEDGDADSQVYYFGNGTYYNPQTGLYGGHVSNPNGTAGVTFSTNTPIVPGVPNTGAGGQSVILWLGLVLSGILAVTGLTYIAASTRRSPRG